MHSKPGGTALPHGWVFHPRQSLWPYVVVPLALAAVTALLAALGFAAAALPVMLGWFFDNTTASQPQDHLLGQADGGAATAQPETVTAVHYLPATALPDRYADMTISGTNVNAPVYYGDTSRILNRGVGTYMENSSASLPSERKNNSAVGLFNTFFNDLQHAEEGPP